MITTPRRAQSHENRMPTPRKAASVITSFSMIVAGLGVAAGLQLASAATGTISGSVFEDYNADGAIDTREPGVNGVSVVAVDSSGNRSKRVLTDADGAYEVDLGVAADADLGAGPYRVEFSGWPMHLEEGPLGIDSGSSIQFVDADATNVSLGLAAPSDYCHDNPDVSSTCFVYAGIGDSASWAAVVSVDWDTTDNNSTNNPNGPTDWMRDAAGEATGETVLATIGQVGAVWGEAWDRHTGAIYVGAFVKRHTALGPTGNPTTIYRIDTAGTPDDTSDDTVAPWTTVDPSAPDPHSGASDGWHKDFDAFDAVYQSGLGDVELSPDGSTLYTIDLRNKTLVMIEVETDGSAGAMSTTPIVGSMGTTTDHGGDSGDSGDSGDGSCSTDDLQPAGLGVDSDGRVHVGVVCTAASTTDIEDYGVDGTEDQIDGWEDAEDLVPGDPHQLRAYVVEWDGLAGGSFTPVLEFPLDGPRGCIAFGRRCPFGGDSEWRPWVEAYPYEVFEDSYPQPVVTDIDFDNDTMLVAIADRWGHQSGPETRMRRPDGSTLRFRHPVAGGDLVRACSNGDGTYAVEGTGGCASGTSTAGESEFFVDDRYRRTHLETGLGSVAVAPGFDSFIHTQMDPVNAAKTWRSGGFAWTSPETGRKERGLRIYDGRNFTPKGTFEKASGLGDVELLCEGAPLSIGNRVWLDLDGNGQQDAGEPGINGVTVSLELADGTPVTSTTSATSSKGAAGTWGFPIEPATAYVVSFDASTATGLPLGIDADQLVLADQHVGDSRLDSDADADGHVSVAPRSAGENDHSLDVGFVPISLSRSLDIEKQVKSENGTGGFIDADSTGNGAGIAWYDTGVAITYELSVTNTGEAVLENIVVTDSLVPTCSSTIAALDPGANKTWQCQAPGQPDAGRLVNDVSAALSWTPLYGPDVGVLQVVDDTDDAVVEVVSRDVSIQKSTATGTPYGAGDDVTYTYRVTNIGTVDLSLGVPTRVSDDKCSSVASVGDPNVGDLDKDGILDVEADINGVDDGPGEVWQFTCTNSISLDDVDQDGSGPLTTLTNLVSAIGTPVTPDGGSTGLGDVSSTDNETITVYEPGLSIETQVWDPVDDAWRNADSLDGETGVDALSVQLHTGATAQYRFVLVNTGNVYLSDATVSVSGSHITGCDGPHVVTTTLAPGATATVAGDGSCVSGALAGAGSVLIGTATVSADAVSAAGEKIVDLAAVTDSDPASIELIEARIAVAKSPGLQTLADGGDASWSFAITNTSIEVDELVDVTINDVQSFDAVCDPVYDSGDTDGDSRLDSSEEWIYGCTLSAVSMSGSDVVTVTAGVPDGYSTPPIPDDQTRWTVSAQASASHRVGRLSISKQVRIADLMANGGGASGAGPWSDNVTVRVGEAVDFRVLVENVGDAEIVGVVVNDDQCQLTIDSVTGDGSGAATIADQLAILSVGEAWDYRCAGSSPDPGAVVNVATVSGSVVANPGPGDAPTPEADMVAGDSLGPVDATATFTGVEPSLAVLMVHERTAGPADADGVAGTEGTNDAVLPVYRPGDQMTVTITVRNDGDVELRDITLDHDLPLVAVCGVVSGSFDSLAPGRSITTQCRFDAASSGETHRASATATSSISISGHELGPVISDANDADDASYLVTRIDLTKEIIVDGEAFGADNALDAVPILDETAVTWRLRATNSGQVDLLNVSVLDPIDADGDEIPDCLFDPIPRLLPGESVVLECSSVVTADLENTGTVHAEAEDPSDGEGHVVTVVSSDVAFVQLLRRAAVGDVVWHDIDGDGLQDPDEPGLAGVTVQLLDPSAAIIAEVQTAGDGTYLFDRLAPGSYQVQAVVPQGWKAGPSGVVFATTLDPGEADLNRDVGLYQPGTIGDRVWFDANANGLQDEDELGVAAVSVVLLGADGTELSRTETGDDGRYVFTDLAPGEYRVTVGAPDTHAFSAPNSGDESLDSDVDATGLSEPLVIRSGNPAIDVDAGIYEPASIGNLVWLDANQDGFQDETEVGVAGVTVALHDEVGVVVATQVTDSDGRYSFEGLRPGKYQIEVIVPAGLMLTNHDAVAGDVTDSDVDAVTGLTILTVLASGQKDLSWDAGLIVPTVVLSSPVETSTEALAFTGRTVTGLLAAGFLLLGLGGTARVVSDRLKRTPAVADLT